MNNYWFWVCLGGIICFEYQKPSHKIHNVMLQNIQMWLRGSHLVGGRDPEKEERSVASFFLAAKKIDIKRDQLTHENNSLWVYPLEV